MKEREQTPARVPLPPGWDLKRSYWRNMLISDLIILVAAITLIALSSFLTNRVPVPDVAYEADALDPEFFHAMGERGGEQGEHSYSNANRSRYHEALTIRQTRYIIVPDDPQVSRPSTEQRPQSNVYHLSSASDGASDAMFTASGYLGRLSGIPQQQITVSRATSYLPDLTPIGQRHSRGFPTQMIYTNDIVSKPVIDVRWIRSPMLDKHRDTALVLVDMLLGPDTLDILVVEEQPLFKGYGDMVLEGLLKGKHTPMKVNGIERTTQVLLTVYLCLDCKEINLAVQTVDIRY